MQTVAAPDGRALAVAEWGAVDGVPVFSLHGTPGCRLLWRAAAEHDLEELLRSSGVRLLRIRPSGVRPLRSAARPERCGYGCGRLSDRGCARARSGRCPGRLERCRSRARRRRRPGCACATPRARRPDGSPRSNGGDRVVVRAGRGRPQLCRLRGRRRRAVRRGRRGPRMPSCEQKRPAATHETRRSSSRRGTAPAAGSTA